MNSGSASASEILAGVLQDHDRAIVIGQNSFGKGLVQTVLSIDRESRLKVTTAKYYLPSGRLIQRQEIAADIRLDDMLTEDSSSYYSGNERRFLGGGGISPDVAVSPRQTSYLEEEIWRKGLFFRYAVEYAGANSSLILPVEVDEDMLDDFTAWLCI